MTAESPGRDVAERTIPDEALVRQFQEGSEGAFNVLVGRYKDRLINFAYRFLGDYDEADDVVQETFIRVYYHKDAFRPVARFSTWLYTIATNLARTQLRRRKRHAIFSLGRKGRDRDEKDFDLLDTRNAPDEMADQSLRHRAIQKALDAMNPKFREAVILCDLQELTYEEICEITGLNIGTVKSRLNRGRAELKALLKEALDE